MNRPALLLAAIALVGVSASSVYGGDSGATQKKKPAPPKPKAPPVAAVKVEVFLAQGSELTPLTDGATISGEVTFRIRAQASDPITSVEMTVASDLRDTDTSTPYEIKLDTLGEEEGDLALTFKAYTSKGASGTKAVRVRVDNGSSLGLEGLLRKGNDAYNAGRFEEALTAGRVAVKLDAKSVPANLLLARTYLRQRAFDRAQKFAEDAAAADAKSLEAQEVLAQVGVQRAFSVTSRPGSDPAEAQRAIREALVGAAQARQRAQDARYEGLPAGASVTERADAAIAAGRFAAAGDILDEAFKSDVSNAGLANRLAYARLMLGNLRGASEALTILGKAGKLDAYSYALQGVLASELGDEKAADEAFKNGLLENPDSFGVRTAQASVALKRGRTTELKNLAQGLGRDVNSRTEANFYLSAVNNRLQNYDVSRKQFFDAVRVDPANADIYIEQGNQAVQFALNETSDAKGMEAFLASAETMYSVALQARPSSGPGLIGLSMVANLRGDDKEAVKFAEAATRAAPGSAAAQYALAGALTLRQKKLAGLIANVRKDKTAPTDPAEREAFERKIAAERASLQAQEREAFENIAAARAAGGRLDARARDLPVPGGLDVYRYFTGYGRSPLISPPALG